MRACSPAERIPYCRFSYEYAVYDQHGRQIGRVRQVGQSAAKKIVRAPSSVDQFLTHNCRSSRPRAHRC